MKRFRAFTPDEPRLGIHTWFEPGCVFEEWEADKVSGNVPVRVTGPDGGPSLARRGVPVRLVGQRPEHDRLGQPVGWGGMWEVIAEDPPPMRVHVGVLTCLFTGVMLCQPADLFAVLHHLAGNPVRTDEQAAAVADACTEWLARGPANRVYRLWYGREVPRYDTTAEYAALLDGLVLGLGYDSTLIPVPPFPVEVPPERLTVEGTRTLDVRDDVADQLRRHGRAN